MNLIEAKELLENNGYIIDEGIFDSIKNKFFKKKEEAPEVKPQNKKLYDDQIEKTSQQAYNHTTDSMSTLKQIATNFNGKNAGELKQLWSGLSKLLNKHGMSAKNHDYYLGVTNDNTKFSVWAYIAYPEKDWTDIKVIGTVKANVFEYKYTTNYDLDDSSLKGQADDLNEWLTELDSIALKLFKGVSREEWEEGAHQNESVNKAIKLLESVGYIVEDTDDWDEADMPIGTPKQRADRVNKHSSFRDLDHKTTDAANFNIKNLFYGVEKELKKVYKKVEIEASDYDDVERNQFVRYYFKYNKSSYVLEVMYYDEKGVIVMQIIDEDAIGANTDTFDITTIDDAIEQIVEFTNDNV